MKVWIPHPQGPQLLRSQLPADVTVEVYAEGGQFPSDPAQVDVLTPPFLGDADQIGLKAMSRLRVIRRLTAGAVLWVGMTPPGVVLCDARGVHTSSTSEWVVAAILSYLRQFPRFARAQAARHWDYTPTDELAGKRVLIVGAGDIGEATARRLAPFEVELTRVARQARPGVRGIGELPDLLPHADVVVILTPLTDQTAQLVDAGFLAQMADGALLVNAARGPVADTDALADALASGRINAALDVTDPEPLPADHPLWSMPNVLLTPHVAGSVGGMAPRAYRLVAEQVRRLHAGEELQNVVTDGY
ncbi:MAG: 2-hydroxyacid dehydrogenase [Micromonosporaceae bacterium]